MGLRLGMRVQGLARPYPGHFLCLYLQVVCSLSACARVFAGTATARRRVRGSRSRTQSQAAPTSRATSAATAVLATKPRASASASDEFARLPRILLPCCFAKRSAPLTRLAPTSSLRPLFRCQSDLFDGAACHTLPCPYNNSEECGGRGKCWTLNKLARCASQLPCTQATNSTSVCF